MSIQLLRFPYLVQRLILKQMDYGDLFFFSLISKKSINLIQIVRWREVKGIEYLVNKEMISVCINNGQIDQRGLLEIYPKKSDEKLEKITVSGTELDYRMPTETHLHAFFPNEDVNNEAIAEIIYDQVRIVFGSHVKCLLLEASCEEQLFLPKRLPFCETRVFSYIQNQAKLFDEYFDAIPVQDYISLFPDLEGHFRRDSKFFDARELDMIGYGTIGTLIMENFRGKIAHVKYVECNDNDVIDFLKRWKSKEALEKLESFYGELRDYFEDFRLSPETIQNAVEIKKLPESFGPQTIKCSKIGCHYLFNTLTVIETSSYLVRNDGIVALISVAPYEFVLKVTKYTEEEMLQMKGFPLD